MKHILLVLSLVLAYVSASDKSAAALKLGWTLLNKASSDEIHTFNIYTKCPRAAELFDVVGKVSDPLSPSYGQYLTQDEVTALVAPSDDAHAAIRDWIAPYHPSHYEMVSNRDVISVSMKVSDVERLFNLNINVYVHKNGKRILRSESEIEIPAQMQEHIHMIQGISEFPVLRKRSVNQDRVVKAEGPENEALPTFTRIRGTDHSISVSFIPVCLNGNATKSASQPCSDYPPALLMAQIDLTSTLSAVNTSMSFIGAVACENNDDVGAIVCTVVVPKVPNYLILNLALREIFGQSKVGPVVRYPYRVVAAPAVVPSAIQEYHKIPIDYIVTQVNATQAVAEFEQQYFNAADLNLFFEEMGLPTGAPVTIIGPNDETNPGIEANLDIQYIMGVAPGAATTFWSIFANSTLEIDDILQWAVAMSNHKNPPLVNSLSYGMTEKNVDKYLGKGYLARSDIEFAKLAARGITIIIADGDSGANDLGPEPMGQDSCEEMSPDWPSQSPFVTAVSATMLTTNSLPICFLPTSKGGVNCDNFPLGEVPTSVELGLPWTTGGGISNTASMPSYQTAFVQQYFKKLQQSNLLPPNNVFNAKGRGYPDVSMVGHNLLVAQNGSFISVDGTSASAPIFAGFVTLLNDVRLGAGKAPLGFLNPLLYHVAEQYPGAYNDIVVGNNRCGDVGFQPTCCEYGWHATEGFDLVTGLGSPNFEVWKDVVLKL